jgi:O-antigen/teichoic acid export membrane protein
MNFLRSLKDISTIGVGDIGSKGITAIFWFYLASIILPSAYGEIHYFLNIAAIVSTFSLIGTQNSLTVYFAKNNSIVSTLSFISALAAIVSFLILFIFFNRFDIALLVIGNVIFVLGISNFLGKKDFKKYTIFSIVQKTLMVTFSLIVYSYFGVEWILLAISLSYMIYLPIIFKNIKTYKIDFLSLKNNKHFISSNYFLMLTNICTKQVDKLLIAPILGLSVLGNYALAEQIILILTIMPSIIFKYVLPHTANGISTEKLEKVTILFSILLTALSIILMPIILPIFFETYTDVILLIQIMSLSVVPTTITIFYFAKILAMEKATIPLMGGIISSIITVTGMIGLGSLYGSTGIAITYVLTYSIFCIFNYVMYKRIISKHEM